MGLTIATRDRRFSLKMDEERCEALFNTIVRGILAGDTLHAESDIDSKPVKTDNEPERWCENEYK